MLYFFTEKLKYYNIGRDFTRFHLSLRDECCRKNDFSEKIQHF